MNACLRCSDAFRWVWHGLVVLACMAFLPASAQAHKASDSYLLISEAPIGSGTLRWDIALRDLDLPLELDRNADALLSWGEVRTRLAEIVAYAAAQLSLNAGRCGVDWHAEGVEKRTDGSYLVLAGRFDCGHVRLNGIAYRLFGELDPTHRGLVRLSRGQEEVLSLSLDPLAGEVVLPGSRESLGGGFVARGIHHILIGYDHMLFLLCLLLPAVLRRTAQGWRPVERLADAFWPVATTVTLFTVAHSITLGLATLGFVYVPARIVEPAIAFTIAVAAWNNIRPLWQPCNKIYTFAFGLIHGFGFAGVLAELGLPRSGFALTLLQFNLGVELGQLFVVSIAVCLLFALRRLPAYPGTLMPRASMFAIGLAAIWFAERAFDFRLIS